MGYAKTTEQICVSTNRTETDQYIYQSGVCRDVTFDTPLVILNPSFFSTEILMFENGFNTGILQTPEAQRIIQYFQYLVENGNEISVSSNNTSLK